MACVDICPKGAIKIEDSLVAYNAVMDEEKCIDCGACKKVCQKNNPCASTSSVEWYQGWAQDEELRIRCSSGGFAAAISKTFVEDGGMVCSCVFRDGGFTFEFAGKVEELSKFTGSKYVKSNPAGIYKQIKSALQNGRKVLFIGLPCQVAAVKNYIHGSLQENLYTVDLICHGTPSPELLNLFLKQYGRSLNSIHEIIFRVKAKMQIYGDHKGIITKGVSDKYTIAFLNALTYTENCYECDYAKLQRVSDLTLGDSWGSNLPMDEQKKGVSLALCQTEKGVQLLKKAEVALLTVELERAVENNHQLDHPSVRPAGRDTFFNGIKQKKRFNRLIFKCFPKQCLRQDVKELLILTKIIRGDKQYIE